MASYSFEPSVGQNFTFSPVLDGNTYNATVTWNMFGQRWYINLYDLSGNLIVSRALASSGPRQSILSATWDLNIVTVTSQLPHYLPIGSAAQLRIFSMTPSTYNGSYLCRITGSDTFEYDLAGDPGQVVSAGSYGQVTDLADGYFTSSVLLYYADSSNFETVP